MQHFADIALPPVMDGEMNFYPAKYKTTYKNWLDNIQDWCISRQLWWGHRIPAYFYGDGEEDFVVAETADEALKMAQAKTGNAALTADDLKQDEDALDTWFSSWLWPISLFDGINNPGNEELNYYYPTSDLVTGPDIIFFWVARMIMAGEEYTDKIPFKNVYFTGIVRDKLGRKMSKSLGNSPDPIDLFRKYRISEALMAVYRLFWDEFSSWYLEMVKPAYINGEAQPIDRATYDKTLRFFETLLKMLHPFMPFITEELWQHIYDRKDGESIMRDALKVAAPTEAELTLISQIEEVKQIVSGVRMVRNQKNIAPKEQLALQAIGTNAFAAYNAVITKMANLSSIDVVSDKDASASAFMVGTHEFAVPLGDLIDVEAEIAKAEAQLKHLEGFLMGIRKKLANEKFVANAPEAVVAMERKKESDSLEKIAALQESIAELRKK